MEWSCLRRWQVALYDHNYKKELQDVSEKIVQDFGGEFSISQDFKVVYYFDTRNNGFMFLGLDHLKKWYAERLEQLQARLGKNTNDDQGSEDNNEDNDGEFEDEF